MRRFLKKVIFMSLPIVVVAIFMEILLRNTPNDYLFKKEYLDVHASNIETLILGNSYSYYGIDPSYFSSNTFNASHVSQSLDYDLEILKKYEHQFKNLKTIILPVSYFTLFENLETEPDSWRVKNYVIYYKMHTSNSLINHTEVLSNRVNVNLMRLWLRYILKRPMISCSELGWGTEFHSEKALNLVETGKSAVLRHTKDIYDDRIIDIYNNNVLILDTIATWCKSRNVKLILYTPPAFKTYRQYLNKDQLDLSIKTAQRIVIENDNCTYVNFLEDPNFIEKDYYDADHLSEIGAKKLSKAMTSLIDN